MIIYFVVVVITIKYYLRHKCSLSSLISPLERVTSHQRPLSTFKPVSQERKTCVPRETTFLNNLAAPLSAVFWIISNLIFTSIFSIYPTNFCDTAPKTLVKIGNIITLSIYFVFSPHLLTFVICLPFYFLLFSLSIIWNFTSFFSFQLT